MGILYRFRNPCANGLRHFGNTSRQPAVGLLIQVVIAMHIALPWGSWLLLSGCRKDKTRQWFISISAHQASGADLQRWLISSEPPALRHDPLPDAA